MVFQVLLLWSVLPFIGFSMAQDDQTTAENLTTSLLLPSELFSSTQVSTTPTSRTFLGQITASSMTTYYTIDCNGSNVDSTSFCLDRSYTFSGYSGVTAYPLGLDKIICSTLSTGGAECTNTPLDGVTASAYTVSESSAYFNAIFTGTGVADYISAEATATATGTHQSPSSGLPSSAKLSIGLGAPIGAIVSALCAFFSYRFYKKRHCLRSKGREPELQLDFDGASLTSESEKTISKTTETGISQVVGHEYHFSGVTRQA